MHVFQGLTRARRQRFNQLTHRTILNLLGLFRSELQCKLGYVLRSMAQQESLEGLRLEEARECIHRLI